MVCVSSKWADQIIAEHAKTLTHGNSAKTRVLIVSTDPDGDIKVVDNVLRNDAKTNKVTYEVISAKEHWEYYHNFSQLPMSKLELDKIEFIEKLKFDIKPTVILISPKHEDLMNELYDLELIDDTPLFETTDYHVWSTLNMTINEPAILTFSVPATTGKVGEIFKKKLKEGKKTIPNEPSTRVLWIDGGHGGQRKKIRDNWFRYPVSSYLICGILIACCSILFKAGFDLSVMLVVAGFIAIVLFVVLFILKNRRKEYAHRQEYAPVGGKSGFTDKTYLNAMFYAWACEDVGIQPNAVQFKYKPKGDFVSWTSPSFPRPDICIDPVIASPLPPNSLLNDPDLNKMKFRVMNIQDYHNTPDLRGDDPHTVRKRRKEFLEDVKRYNPTVIFIGWCFSANGDVALALRGSPVLSLMLLKDDLRNISGVATAELDPQQIEIIQRLSEGDIRHCVFSGSSGTGKTYMCAEFGKILAAKLINEIIGIQLEIVVCRLWPGNVEEALLYQVWREKYFPGVEGFNVTYLEVTQMCERFGVVYKEYIENKNDIVGLIIAVCEKCDSDNCAKNDESRTIFLLDEAVMDSKDGVCDYSPLADLCRLKTVYTATCVNPQQFGGEFTMKLPVACPVPCDKGHIHGCTLSAQLLNCYRNTEEIRQVLQFWSDHHVGLLSRIDDRMGANLPPRPAGQHSAVTWVQCHSQENMEKTASDTLHMLDNNNEKDVQILYDKSDVVASAVVTNVKGYYKAAHFMQFYGCEADHIVYVCNKVIQPEVLSRPRRGLIVITGPDLHPVSQSLMKALAGDHHSETSRGVVRCLNKPCPWSCGHVSPVAHHVRVDASS